MILHGRYDCSRLLKEGQGVETYLAQDLEAAGAPVVVKLVHIETVDPAVRTRLEHEAGVLSRLGESSVRPLLDYARDETFLYFVQPFLPGQDLAERLGGGPLSVASTLVVAADLLAALQRAHDRGILHRDVKPANVIVRGSDMVEGAALIDFGLARSASLDPSVRDHAVGTARYLAPEQAGLIDSPVDERSDLYSLGVVLYECLAGRPPFEGSNVGEVLRQHLSMPVAGLSAAGVVVPRALEAAVLRLLGKEPGQRYQSASAALSDIEQIAAGLARGVSDPPVVIGLQDARSTLTVPAFVGRAAELASLSAHLEAAGRGEGGLVFIVAESGGGKTGLVDEFAARAAWDGAWILRGQGVDQVAKHPYQLLEGVAAGIGAAASEHPALGARLRAQLGDNAVAVAVALPELGGLLDRGPARSLPEAYGEVRSISALAALVDVLGTTDRPALVLLDDCQWADGLTIKLLGEWQAEAGRRGSHVLVVAAFRSEAVGPEHSLRQIVPRETLFLLPLTLPEIRDMVRSMAGPLPDEAVATVAQLAEGSPFMAAEVLHGLVECGALSQSTDSASRWRVDEAALADAQTSRRAARFLVKRLEQLPVDALHLLSIGAVLGKDFDLHLAMDLAATGPGRGKRAVDEARRRRIVWVDEVRGRCQFSHDKLREALLGALAPEERTRLHLRAAQRIEVVDPGRSFELAYHFDAAGAVERALPYALEAAEHARRQYTLEIAEAHYRMAERAVPDANAATQARVAEGLGDVLTLRGAYTEADVRFQRALNLAPDRVSRAALQGKLGDVAFKCGDLGEARCSLEGALRNLRFRVPRTRLGLAGALGWEVMVQICHTLVPSLTLGRRSLEEAGSQLLAMRLYSRLAYVYWFHSGRVRCAWAHLREMNLAERYPPTSELAQAYSEHGPVMTMIPWFARGTAYVQRSLAIRTELGDVWGQGQSLNFYGVALYAASRYREAIEKCSEAIRLLERTGDRWEVNTGAWNIAFARYRLGELGPAADAARRVHEAALAIGDQGAAGISLSGWARAAEGDLPAAVIHAQLERDDEDASTSVEIRLAEGVRLLAAGRPSEAVDILRQARSIVRKAGLRQEYVAPVLPWLATALRSQMEAHPPYSVAARRRLIRDAVRVARKAARLSRGYANNRPHALREQGLMAAMAGRPARARRRLDASLVVARAQGARFEEAQTLEARGRLGLELGWSDAAAELRTGEALIIEVRPAPVPTVLPDAVAGPPTLALADRFATLLEVGRNIASASDPEAVYDAVRVAALTLLRGERCHVLDVSGGLRPDLTKVSGEVVDHLSRTIVGQALDAGRPVAWGRAEANDAGESLVFSDVQSVLCAPIACKGVARACFYVTHRQIGGLFGPVEVQLASFIATLAGAALEHVAGSEARFQSLAQNSSDVITIIDADGLITYQSSSVERVLGWAPADLTGSRLADLIHAEDVGRSIDTVNEALQDPKVNAVLECRLRTSDGSWLHTETTLTNLLHDPSVRGVVLNTRDVSERKRADDELHRTFSLLTATLQSTADGILAVDSDGRIVSFNRKFVEMWGIPQEIMDCRDDEQTLAFVVRQLKDPEAFGSKVRELYADPSADSCDVLEFKDGRVFERFSQPQRIDHQVVGRVWSFREVTAHRRAEEELAAARDQALEASRMKSQFLANMSHEIRTPMSGVLGMTHLLLDSDLDPCQRRYLHTLRDSGENLLAIINDILDFSKVEAGKLELEYIDFDVVALVEGVVGLIEARARGKGLTIQLVCGPDLPSCVRGDPGRVRQIVTNLVDNAVKFTESGGVVIRVVPARADRIRFEVVDTGIGIDPASRDRVLGVFLQADNSTTRRFGGTGLGVAISHRLVELMGGALDYDSDPGQGSTFWFEVPLPSAGHAPDNSGGRHREPGAPLTAQALAMPGAAVLLVEDSELHQLVARVMLEKLGYQVDVSENGAQAVEAFQSKRYDVILMDCLMPVVDGYEATARIRRLEGPARHTPIVALTASAMSGDRERCLVAGMDDYLTKPIDPAAFAGALARFRSGVAQTPEVDAADRIALPSAAPAGNELDAAVLERLRSLDGSTNTSLFTEIVQVFLADAPVTMSKVRAAVARGDAPGARVAVHTLKGSCGLLGAIDMAELCVELEKVVCAGDLNGARRLIESLDAAFSDARRALEREMNASVC